MEHQSQFDRYKQLLSYIHAHFAEDISSKDIERVSLYSYRHINRIFAALHHETIGQYIKRLRLEKAASYIKFSNHSISDISFEAGYNDLAAFSKAFKKMFFNSPKAFRQSEQLKWSLAEKAIDPAIPWEDQLEFKTEVVPEFDFLFLGCQGDYSHVKQINKTWKQLIRYAKKKDLITDRTVFFAEILDDNDITASFRCRYNAAILLNRTPDFELDGLFQVKHHSRQKYAVFLHKGSHESSIDTYGRIYARWMVDVGLEFEDKPILEFYLNDDAQTPKEELLTEIYIPII